MEMHNIPFGVTDWSSLMPERHAGLEGHSLWRTQNFNNIRVRIVEYSAGYVADHWCEKGHVLLCLEGELITELADGRIFTLRPGMSYQVADQAEAHRATSPHGAKLFIVD